MDISLTLDDVQRAGFPMGAEPLIALDLADTLITITTPSTDLIGDPGRADVWWGLQAARLPSSPTPELGATRQLRAALRDLFDAHLEGRSAAPTSIDDLNAFAASVPTSPRLLGQYPARTETRWHTEHGGNPALAAIASGAINLFGDESRLAELRRCANEGCSMLFLASNRRRVWCTANICGNRARVARHYERTHRDDV
ncbi:MAG TPA: ABATE domain-containing protein [Pseudonocardia sp.]|nr:ABATE domain-containing protein [Pseudonocardia sp.]